VRHCGREKVSSDQQGPGKKRSTAVCHDRRTAISGSFLLVKKSERVVRGNSERNRPRNSQRPEELLADEEKGLNGDLIRKARGKPEPVFTKVARRGQLEVSSNTAQ